MVIITMYIIEKKYRVVVVYAYVWLLFIINCSGLSLYFLHLFNSVSLKKNLLMTIIKDQRDYISIYYFHVNSYMFTILALFDIL